MHVEHVLEMTTSLFSEQWRGKIVFSFMETILRDDSYFVAILWDAKLWEGVEH